MKGFQVCTSSPDMAKSVTTSNVLFAKNPKLEFQTLISSRKKLYWQTLGKKVTPWQKLPIFWLKKVSVERPKNRKI